MKNVKHLILSAFAGAALFATAAYATQVVSDNLQVDGTLLVRNQITTVPARAITSGGDQSGGHCSTSTANFCVYFGTGAPTISAAKGSLYLNNAGSSTSTRLFINSDGATTWVAVTTAS